MHLYGPLGNDVVADLDDAYWSDLFEWILTQAWQRNRWAAQDMVRVHDAENEVYIGHAMQDAALKEGEEVIQGGWDHDHCEVCSWKLMESTDEAVNTGYCADETYWLCTPCHFALFGTGEDQDDADVSV